MCEKTSLIIASPVVPLPRWQWRERRRSVIPRKAEGSVGNHTFEQQLDQSNRFWSESLPSQHSLSVFIRGNGSARGSKTSLSVFAFRLQWEQRQEHTMGKRPVPKRNSSIREYKPKRKIQGCRLRYTAGKKNLQTSENNRQKKQQHQTIKRVFGQKKNCRAANLKTKPPLSANTWRERAPSWGGGDFFLFFEEGMRKCSWNEYQKVVATRGGGQQQQRRYNH